MPISAVQFEIPQVQTSLCLNCWRPIEHPIGVVRKFCCRDCFDEYRPKTVYKKVCLTCKKAFETKNKKQKFCSRPCIRKETACLICGTEIVSKGNRVYCSDICHAKALWMKQQIKEVKCLLQLLVWMVQGNLHYSRS